MVRAILALDQGTTSSRAILFDQTGTVMGVSQREFRQHYPQGGWVEHDATEIWNTQLAVAREVLEKCNLPATEVAAIGITNQRETTVVWDRKTGHPIHHAIVWQDRRTAGYCDQLRADGHAEMISQRTGLVVDAYFSATKLRWLLDNVSGARAKAEAGELAFGTIDSWLLWNLSGGELHVTDISNASRTMLMNLETGQWDDRLLELFHIPRSVLPRSEARVKFLENLDSICSAQPFRWAGRPAINNQLYLDKIALAMAWQKTPMEQAASC